MRCPFGRPRPPKIHNGPFQFGVSGDFLDYLDEIEAREAEEYWAGYNAFLGRHPTCWLRFLHWLGLRP